MEKTLPVTVMFALIAGLASAETTVQSCGRMVAFDAPPQRAVSHDVNLTEMMLVLGLADRMVGYTGISGWKTLDENMTAGVEELPELSSKYPSKEVLITGRSMIGASSRRPPITRAFARASSS